MIRYVPHSSIDIGAWDDRLQRAPNGLWYGLSDVLSAASPGWDALIDEEADVQMPLPWRSKFGIKYIYRPFLLQQQGPFGANVDADAARRFVEAVPPKFKYMDFYLSAGPQEKPFSEQQNITLSLRADITALRSAYSENMRRNLKKIDPRALTFDPQVSLTDLTSFFIRSPQFSKWGITRRQLQTMDRLFAFAQAQGTSIVCGMRSGNELVAGAFFVKWGGRLIFLKGLASAKGRELRAMHALIDRVIADHAGQDVILDFAGSNDPELARFYMGFGGLPSVYLRALVNRLPPILRMLRS
jgi:hypothetical protein